MCASIRRPLAFFMKTFLLPFVLGAVVFSVLCSSTASAQALIISEFRLQGVSGVNDEFIELYNPAAAPLTVTATDASAGFAVVASDGVVRGVVPNGTVIPGHGHYLVVNSVGYSLASYPGANGTTATGDVTYTADIPRNAGIAVFSSSTTFDLTTRLDAVGSVSEANTLYREGAGYPAISNFSIDCSLYRFHSPTGNASISDPAFSFATDGQPRDTADNAADFAFVDTNGTSAGAGQRVGAPGPENLSAPVASWNAAVNLAATLPDTAVGAFSAPNRARNLTSDPANNSTFGALSINRTFTNTTGAPLTSLRFRVIKLTTFPAPTGIADLRPRSSTTAVVSTVGGPVTVEGTTIEQPPSQPNGGGWNTSLNVPSVTVGTPLADGASINLNFLFGIQQTGQYNVALLAEGSPSVSGLIFVNGHTDLNATQTVTGTFSPGGTVTYTVTLNSLINQPDNVGNEFAETLPAGLTLVSAMASSGTAIANVGSGNVSWNGSIPSGGAVTITITATIGAATPLGTVIAAQGTASFDAYASGTNTDTTSTDDPALTGLADATSFTVVGPPPVIAGSAIVTGDPTAGSTATYTITLTNTGGGNQLDNPGNEFSMTLPSGLSLISGSATSGTVISGGATASWNGTIPASGGSVTLTITATINAVAPGTRLSAQGTINYDADANGTNEASVLTDDPTRSGLSDATFFYVLPPLPPSGTRVIASQTTPVAIPTGPGVVTSTIVVSGAAPYLYDLNLITFLTHTFSADLDITLTSPAGTVVTLTTDNGAGNDDVFNGTFWDDSANPAGQVPYTTNNGLVTDNAYVNATLASPLAVEEALGAFLGEDPNGTWTLTVSDDLAGDGGNLDSWSVNIISLPAAPATTAASFTQATPVAIPTGPAVVTSTIVVAGAGTSLLDVNLSTFITHTFAADMDVTLTSPAGTVVTITTDNGAGNDNVFNGTVWDDDANPAGQVPYTTNNGVVTDHLYVNLTTATPTVPEEALGAFIGEDPNGTWTLTISDDLAGDGGSLDSWTLDFITALTGTATPTAVQTTPTATLSRQNGLFQLVVDVTNTTGVAISGFRLSVDSSAYLAAFPSLRLYNASSAPGVSPAFVDYPFPVAAGATVPVSLSFYTSTRTFPSPFSPVLSVTTIATQLPAGAYTAGATEATVRQNTAGVILLEWATTAGLWYQIQYSDDMATWYTSPVPIQSPSNRMQWSDTGPPFTATAPGAARFYRISQITFP